MAKVRQALRSLLKFIKLIIVLSLFGAFVYYVNTYHGEELKKFYLKFDTWGITETGRAELHRRQAIENLESQGVPFIQQEALKNRTVFIGATSEMVLLALGKPSKEPELNSQNQQVWIYNFDDYSRSTYLYFDKVNNKWILTKAEKISK